MNKIKFAIIGGDRRQTYAASALMAAGHKVNIWGCGADAIPGLTFCGNCRRAVEDCDVAVLPLPASLDGVNIQSPAAGDVQIRLEELLHWIRKDTVITGGYLSREFVDTAAERGFRIYDYYDNEELKIQNALASAEGAVMTAMNNTNSVICGSHTAITGYGRIGKLLARLLYDMGSEVTVFARSSQALALAEADRYHTDRIVDTGVSDRICDGFDVIFNTVPARIIGRQTLMSMNRESLLIELASKPGGFEASDARDAGIRALWATGLSGRYAPLSIGNAIAGSILGICAECGLI